MFGIDSSELLLIAVVALVVIGPKELPGTLRMLGQWMGKLRRMASEFQNQFHEAMREAEMADLKKQVDDLTSQASSYANFDPVSEVRKEFESTQQQIENAIADKPPVDLPSPPSGLATSAEPAPVPAPDSAAVAPPPAPAEPVGAAATPDAVKPDAGGKPA